MGYMYSGRIRDIGPASERLKRAVGIYRRLARLEVEHDRLERKLYEAVAALRDDEVERYIEATS